MKLPHPLPEDGPLINYVGSLDKPNREKAYARVRSLLQTEDGRFLIELMEMATLNRITPLHAGPRALDARHAQSFIASDLRRIADETEYVLPGPKTDQLEHGRPRRGSK
ncbi:MAG: hypothetical protein Unbinned5081contig1001_8 [Prokaryotic dsDNA virus sp.]|nr:MAG: hypothetical protein Unbinned5081contig1001_8 [Prokaryotic dsDNA virus sp.]